MICRLWHGWTTQANADAYEKLLREEVFVGIEARGIAGFRGIEMLRRPVGGEVEFVTLMWFTSLDDVRQFAGEEYAKSVVPEAARRILKRFDAEATHYEVRIPRA
jgi:heme-degrading monooxygenase HmoA